MTQRVQIHPASAKHLKKGHPWVTADKFSAKFPKGKKFVCAKLGEKEFAILLNDPNHPTVKARLWRLNDKSTLNEPDFLYELKGKIMQALDVRKERDWFRDNYYLAFGEADGLPGLFVQKLKEHVLIQIYSDFWNTFEKDLIKFYKELVPGHKLWVQKRNKQREKEFYCVDKKTKEARFTLSGFGVNYEINLNQYYDIGIYTDMSAIREKIKDNFEGKRVLNLYSYTGAYSLFAMSNGATDVVSVDLSSKYIDWLERNIALNEFGEATHRSMTLPVVKALKELAAAEEKFDLIICDPPSSSSDGKKVSKAIDSYKDLVPLMSKLLNKKGEAICFLNTHSVTRRKFEDKMRVYTKDEKISITGSLKLTGDCPSLKGFPEGDYLKGLKLLKK